MNPYRVMDKQVARYVHLQNPDTTEIRDGGVLPEVNKLTLQQKMLDLNR